MLNYFLLKVFNGSDENLYFASIFAQNRVRAGERDRLKGKR